MGFCLEGFLVSFFSVLSRARALERLYGVLLALDAMLVKRERDPVSRYTVELIPSFSFLSSFQSLQATTHLSTEPLSFVSKDSLDDDSVPFR